MVRFAFIGLCALMAACVACLVVGWRQTTKLLQSSRRRKLQRLKTYQARLKPVVSSLLEQVNELDQDAQYRGIPLSRELSTRITDLCEDLVKLGDALLLIDRILQDEDLRHGQRALLSSCRLAGKVSRQMHQVRLLTVDIQSDAKMPL